MMAYLAMMAPSLVELHRVLKESGSVYLHCDPTASHYLRMLLDGIFGASSLVGKQHRCQTRRSIKPAWTTTILLILPHPSVALP